MRVTRDGLLDLLRAVHMGSTALIRAKAIVMAGSDPALVEKIEAIFGKVATELLIPHDLTGLVREVQPWVARSELVLSPPIQELIDTVCTEASYVTELREKGLEPIRTVLFHGPSGTGKTSVASALALALNVPLLICPMDTVVGSYLGETSSRLRKVLEFATRQPCVLFLDEIDAIGKGRGGVNEVGEQGRILTTLLVLLDEAQRRGSETLIVAATNLFTALDSALVRRFDTELCFNLIGTDQANEVTARIFRRAGLEPEQWADAIPVAPATVERWALRRAKALVLEGKRRVESTRPGVVELG